MYVCIYMYVRVYDLLKFHSISSLQPLKFFSDPENYIFKMFVMKKIPHDLRKA